MGLVWKQGESQSKQPADELSASSEHQGASAPALRDSSHAPEAAAHSRSTVVALRTSAEVFQHRQARWAMADSF